jgi:mannose-6-phosphate isomerase-like protein (cupin superfamily)
MLSKKQLAVDAVAKALRLRKQLQIPLSNSLSPLEAAERLGIEVRLLDIPSMEGIYVAGNEPKILLSALRPQGRRNFTCAHEIGHHIFKHGEQFDEIVGEKTAQRKSDPVEFAADCFASFFLMPKATVDNGIKARKLNYQTLQPLQVYALASWLGVGYTTLVSHMKFGLGSILHDQTQVLLQTSPREIRRELLGQTTASHLHIVDEHWVGRAIDMEVGDHVLIPKGTQIEGGQLIRADFLKDGALVEAVQPGIGRLFDEKTGWAAFARVSRHEYTGRSCFRFEEEVDQ